MNKKTLIESAERFLGEDQVLSEANTSDMKLLVTHLAKEAVEDSFEQGEIGNLQLVMDEKIGKIFNSMAEFQKYCKDSWGLEDKKDNWSVIDNRLIYSSLEDEEGIAPYPTELADWKKGKKKLYSVYYDFVVQLITSVKDENEIKNWTGITN